MQLIKLSQVTVTVNLSHHWPCKCGKLGFTFAHHSNSCAIATSLTSYKSMRFQLHVHMKNGEMVEASVSQWVPQVSFQMTIRPCRQASFNFCATASSACMLWSATDEPLKVSSWGKSMRTTGCLWGLPVQWCQDWVLRSQSLSIICLTMASWIYKMLPSSYGNSLTMSITSDLLIRLYSL